MHSLRLALAAALAVLAAPAAEAAGLFAAAERQQVTSLNISADLGPGNIVPPEIRVLPLIGDARYGCFRAHGRVYIVELRTRRVVALLPG